MTRPRPPDPDPEGIVTLPLGLLREVVERVAAREAIGAELEAAFRASVRQTPPPPEPAGHQKARHARRKR
jgi:hypothetical protein